MVYIAHVQNQSEQNLTDDNSDNDSYRQSLILHVWKLLSALGMTVLFSVCKWQHWSRVLEWENGKWEYYTALISVLEMTVLMISWEMTGLMSALEWEIMENTSSDECMGNDFTFTKN